MNDLLIKQVLYGISCLNYEAAAPARSNRAIQFNSLSDISQASAKQLQALQDRDLSPLEILQALLWRFCEEGLFILHRYSLTQHNSPR